MILVSGGSGRLGSLLLPGLLAGGTLVRVLTRSAEAAERLRARGVDVVLGDLRNPDHVARAVAGCTAVVAAATGFGPGHSTPESVDRDGNAALIREAARARVERFVLLSVHGAANDAPIPLFRMKYAAEEALRSSGLAFTIVRPTAYLETYVDLIGAPLRTRGSTMIFGAGRTPTNFVSVRDVAALVLRALRDPDLAGRTIDIGGVDLTMNELSDALHAAAGTTGKVRRMPRGALRTMALVARPFSPFLTRVAQAAVVMDTTETRFDPLAQRATVPGLPFTTLDEVLRRWADTATAVR